MKKSIACLGYFLFIQLILSFSARAVETPSLNALPQTMTVASAKWLHWSRVEPISYYVLKRSINGGSWATEGVYYNLTNGANLSFSQAGTHCFKVIATYSGGWSGFSNETCTYAGYKGAITGQSSVTINQGGSYTFSAASVSISDQDSSTHTPYSIGAGANYTLSGSTIKVASGFYGTLSIPVVYQDDKGFTTNSYNFNITVKYTDPIGIPVMEALPSTVASNNSIWVKWSRVAPIDYYILKRNLNGGDYTTAGIYYNLTNGGYIPFEQAGNHCFKVIATFEGRWSSFSQPVCTYVGEKGQITGQSEVTLSTGIGYTFTDNSVTISDSDSTAHSVYSIKQGVNYAVTGSTVTPSDDFIGTLSIPVSYVDNLGEVTDEYQFKINVNVMAEFSSQSEFEKQWNYHSTACENIADITLGTTEACYRNHSKGYFTKDAVEIVDGSAFLKVNVKETSDTNLGLLTCSAEQLNLAPDVTNRDDRHYILTSGYIISKAKTKFGSFEAGLRYQRVFGTQSAMWVDSDWLAPYAETGQEIDVDEYIPRIDRWHQSHQFTVHSHDEQRKVGCNGVGTTKTCFTRGSDASDDDNGEYYLDMQVQKQGDAFTHNHIFSLEWKNDNGSPTYTLFRDDLEKGMYTHEDLINHAWETDPEKVSDNAGIFIEPDAAYLKFSIEIGKDFFGDKTTDQYDEPLNDQRRLCSVVGSAVNADGTLGTADNREITLGGMKVDFANIRP